MTARQGESVTWTEERKGEIWLLMICSAAEESRWERERERESGWVTAVPLQSSRFGSIPSDLPNIYLITKPPVSCGAIRALSRALALSPSWLFSWV